MMGARQEGDTVPVHAATVLDGPRSGRGRGLAALRDLLTYRRTGRPLQAGAEEAACLFRRFLRETVGRRCVRLALHRKGQPLLGPNWTTAGLAHLEAGGKLDLRDGQADVVFCTDLERARYPERVAAEIGRVLRRAGQLWVQTPCSTPYDPGDREDYWRMTPGGLRLLLREFDEIFCAAYLPAGSVLRSTSFFYGMKPLTGRTGRDLRE